MEMDEKECRSLLSRNIKRYRDIMGFSQLDLALELDISLTFLRDIETGKKWVSPKTLTKLANTLHINVYQLFQPEEEKLLPVFPEASAEAVKYLDNVDAMLEKYIARFVRPALEHSIVRIERSLSRSVQKMRRKYESREKTENAKP
jgi:transcriptional regulator with XRE-family HTH domain